MMRKGETRDISSLLLDANGELKIVAAATLLEQTTPEERMLFCVRHAVYSLPTLELVERLKRIINGRSCIEIGAGNGVLAKALGIVATDNMQQNWPEVRAYYASIQQPVIRYGSNVLEIDANAAVLHYQPEVVLACWVTHFDARQLEAGGKTYGVHEEVILDGCEEYVFVGNQRVHQHKTIWNRPHRLESPDYLYSRTLSGEPNFIARFARSLEAVI